MTHGSVATGHSADVPSWVPEPARHYLAHTESGTSIRALARRAGCHASTVLRQIRSCESRRDDLLVDEGLRRLGRQVLDQAFTGSQIKEVIRVTPTTCDDAGCAALTETRLTAEASRILRRLCETGAILAVSADMDKAVVVREARDGHASRTAVVDRAVAEAMALKSWIVCDAPGRILRYRITAAGRAALNRMLAEGENHAVGFAEAQTSFDYATMTPGTELRLVSLTPSGREIDVEATYGWSVLGGRLDTNLYWRREPGHIAAMPNDKGVALRFRKGL